MTLVVEPKYLDLQWELRKSAMNLRIHYITSNVYKRAGEQGTEDIPLGTQQRHEQEWRPIT